MEQDSDVFSCECLFEIFQTTQQRLASLNLAQAQQYINRVFKVISIEIHPDKNKDHPELANNLSQEVTKTRNILLQWARYNKYMDHDEEILTQTHKCDQIQQTNRYITWLRTAKESNKRKTQDSDSEHCSNKKPRMSDSNNKKPESYKSNSTNESMSDREDSASTTDESTYGSDESINTNKPTNQPEETSTEPSEGSHSPEPQRDEKEHDRPYTIINHTTRRGKAKLQIRREDIEITDWITLEEGDPYKIKQYLSELKTKQPKRFANIMKRPDIGPTLTKMYKDH